VNGSLGEPKPALGQFDHGIRLSPVDPFNLAMLKGSARALFFAHRYGEAITPGPDGNLRVQPFAFSSAYVVVRLGRSVTVKNHERPET
jgi:hypothetical protein